MNPSQKIPSTPTGEKGEFQDFYLTPENIISAIPMEFDLDLSPSLSTGNYYAKSAVADRRDILTENWQGSVWCMAPTHTKPSMWAQKMAAHNNGVALLIGRAFETRYFKIHIQPAALLFGLVLPEILKTESYTCRKGLHSEYICLAAYGEKCCEAVLNSDLDGKIINNHRFNLIPTRTPVTRNHNPVRQRKETA
jgi:hypothetical protein